MLWAFVYTICLEQTNHIHSELCLLQVSFRSPGPFVHKMKLFFFFQFKDLVRAVSQSTRVVSRVYVECPWTKLWAYGYGRWCKTCWDRAGGHPVGWPEPVYKLDAFSHDALMRQQGICNEVTGCMRPPAIGSSAPA